MESTGIWCLYVELWGEVHQNRVKLNENGWIRKRRTQEQISWKGEGWGALEVLLLILFGYCALRWGSSKPVQIEQEGCEYGGIYLPENILSGWASERKESHAIHNFRALCVITHDYRPLLFCLFYSFSYYSNSTSSLSLLSRRTQTIWFKGCLVMVQTVTKYLDNLDIQNLLFVLSQLDPCFPSHGQRSCPHPPLVLPVHLLQNPSSPKTPWQSVHKDSLAIGPNASKSIACGVHR